MQTADEQKLFQTDAQLLTAELRLQKSLGDKKPTVANGYPIVLASKPLKILVEGDDVYVAQNGFVAQRIDLKTGKVMSIFRGHAGPVTSIAIYTSRTTSGVRKLLITGSWDKSIKVWDIETQIQLSSSIVHRDFVKSIEVIECLGLLASGSTDRDILLWDLRKAVEGYDWVQIDEEQRTRQSALDDSRRTTRLPASEQPISIVSADDLGQASLITQEVTANGSTELPRVTTHSAYGPLYGPIPRVDTLKSHTRPVDALAAHPICYLQNTDESIPSQQNGRALRQPHLLVSGDTMGAVKVWHLNPTSELAQPIQSRLNFTGLLHHTSINSIQIIPDLDLAPDARPTARLWTASSDNSVLLSSLDLMSESSDRVISILRLTQPYYIRCALQLSEHLGLNTVLPNWLLTGSTDEDIRVYDLDKIDEETDYSSSLSNRHSHSNIMEKSLSNAWIGCVKAHWHEVCSLGIWVDKASQKSWIISGSLDGTLRKWEIEALRSQFAAQASGLQVQSDPVSEKTDIHLSAEE
ncbi:hypothetical protein CROQUDRAFT_64900 [Cronartium quercuum f. sp. fusiforme G11]|uniref:WD40 repeat-like protein n=1 Tax=Cronartium quercuum f. sp. fusiforme G11 TaxID=708437 RepID=A0A9P6NDA5_9BASI|nr:hypothetical protein CROQUDRAFT_64900 [Cronartium quercuum f. sp. fusiforme G11]